MRHHSTQDHARAEDDEHPAVADGRFVARGGAEFVIYGKDLDEDGAELSGAGADAVAGCSVAGWEDFGGDHVGCYVWACCLLVRAHGEMRGSGKMAG